MFQYPQYTTGLRNGIKKRIFFISDIVRGKAEELGIHLIYLPSYSPRSKSHRTDMESYKEGDVISICGEFKGR
jgi:hypothetical protein